MSVQFGRWNFDGQAVDATFLRRAADLTAKYGPDGETFCARGSLATFFQPFHTTEESWREHQPLVNSSGVVLTWDGRLDNGSELVSLLHLPRGSRETEAQIVLAAYERWDTACFAAIRGDWALTIWDPRGQVLLLAKDFVGARCLFYTLEAHRITWSTVLDPLVLLAERSLQISEEFVAAYLSTLPSADLTPYLGLRAVPPCKFVRIQNRRAITEEYWNFNPSKHIHYKTDVEYEQHFRQVFAEAVRRRMRAFSPVLAELSGGMDSTSIVCVADDLLCRGEAQTPRLDTISYYNDAEPNWNERPYFSLVESKRGRSGYHINTAGTGGALLPPDEDLFFPLPGQDRMVLARSRELRHCLDASQSRVLLSGIGGDEFLGGVPTPIPELQDLLSGFHWLGLSRQLARFSLQQRRPWLHLWFDTVEEFLPQGIRQIYKSPQIAPWLARAFVRRNADVFWADTRRVTLWGPRPSFQGAVSTLDHLRRQLNSSHLSGVANRRVAYPCLDRDLLTFLLSIPREQLVRPGERRSLMRRALAGVVPREIFARKRKAFLGRHPLLMLNSTFSTIEALLHSTIPLLSDWVDEPALFGALAAARHGEIENIIPLLRTLKLGLWLQALVHRKLVSPSPVDRNLATTICSSDKTGTADRLAQHFQPVKVEYSQTEGENDHELQQTRSCEIGGCPRDDREHMPQTLQQSRQLE